MTSETYEIFYEVTQEDIDLGSRSEPQSCPVARSLQRRYDYASIGTFTGTVGVDRASRMKYLDLEHSPETVRFINNFDNRRAVRPGTFSSYITERTD